MPSGLSKASRTFLGQVRRGGKVDQVLNSMARGWLLFGHWVTKEKFREQFLAALTTGTTVGPIVGAKVATSPMMGPTMWNFERGKTV